MLDGFVRKNVFLLFFAVSLILSVMLFIQLAGDLIGKIVMVTSAAAFEIGKMYLWIMYKERRNYIALLVCMAFVIISVTASISFTVGLMKSQYNILNDVTENRNDVKSDIKSIDSEILSLKSAMDGLKPEYITARMKLSDRIEKLRALKAERMASAYESNVKPPESASVFMELSKVFKIKAEVLMLLFFGAFSILLEAGALLLAPFQYKPEPEQQERQTVRISVSKIYKFGELLYNGELSPLRGVQSIAQELNLTDRQARAIFEHLRKNGLVKTDGKRAYPAVKKDEYFAKLKEVA